MENIVVHNTATAQWHALITEAQRSCAIKLDERLESHLVFLLIRFIQSPEIAHSLVALDFLEGNLCSGHSRFIKLQAVGDKCLLFSGLFPDRAIRRRVKISYFIHLGRNAYSELAPSNSQFAHIAHGFVAMMDVLQATRTLFSNTNDLPNLLRAEELWRETADPRSHEILKQHTKGFLIHSNVKLPFH